MNFYKTFTLFLITMCLISCGSKAKYVKETGAVEMKEPFKAQDFRDTNREFYSIRNAVGTGLSAVKAEASSAAQADLAQRIQNTLQNIAGLKLSNSNEVSTQVFKQKLVAVSNSSVSKIMIVDSKIFMRENSDKNGPTKYDYWAVYKVNLNEVVKAANMANLDFNLTLDDF